MNRGSFLQQYCFQLVLAIGLAVLCSVGSASLCFAQESTDIKLRPILPPTPGAPPMQIEQAVQAALDNFPRVLQRRAEVQAARAGVKLQRINEYMPAGLATWEELAASHNRLSQTLFDSPALPTLSGAGVPTPTWHGSFFSGAGYLVDWAPIDFGLHKARIDYAKTQLGQANATLAVTALDAGENAALAFLNLTIAEEQLRAREANVRRIGVFSQVTHQLVDEGLKPGADASLADAQLAEAQNGLIFARQQLKIANAELAETIGRAGTYLTIDPTPMAQHAEPNVVSVTLPDFSSHPLALASQSIIATVIAQRQVLTKSYYPEIHWLGGINTRGSGLDVLFAHYQKKNWYGLAPVVPNWELGFRVSWNFLSFASLHEQKVVNRFQLEAQRQNYADIIQRLKTQDVKARAMVEGAVALAANAPIELEAARQAELRARTRYEAGLATVAQVAEAENMLAQAEVNMAVTRIGVWKALLAVSYAHGDIKAFLAQVASSRRGM